MVHTQVYSNASLLAVARAPAQHHPRIAHVGDMNGAPVCREEDHGASGATLHALHLTRTSQLVQYVLCFDEGKPQSLLRHTVANLVARQELHDIRRGKIRDVVSEWTMAIKNSQSTESVGFV